MRLDVVLKQSGLIKRRTIAKALADNGKIFINEKPSKPSSEVKSGDHLTLLLGQRKVEVEITIETKYKKEIPTFKEISSEKINNA